MPVARKNAKAPPPESSDIYEPEKFQQFIEILEICRNFVQSRSAVPIRLAIVLLDNLAEVLMYHKCRTILEDDDFRTQLLPPQYSREDRTRTERDFTGKVWFLTTKMGLLPESDATVLRVGHTYRNAAFHRDEHNDEANQVIVSLLFQVACSLLSVAYGDRVISGGDESVVRWLRTYGIDQPYLDYRAASCEIGSRLLEGIAVSTTGVREVLIRDLEGRWRGLVAHVSRALPVPELVLDEILKTEEFDAQFDYASGASERFREAQRRIGEGGRVDRQEYLKRQRDYWSEVRDAYDRFIPALTWGDIQRLNTGIARVQRQRTAARVLSVYEVVSDRLAKAEHQLDSAIRKNEAAAEMASEIAQGR